MKNKSTRTELASSKEFPWLKDPERAARFGGLAVLLAGLAVAGYQVSKKLADRVVGYKNEGGDSAAEVSKVDD